MNRFLAENLEAVQRVDRNTYLYLKCDKSYDYLSELRIHLISHSEDTNRFQCLKCHKWFKWREGLNKHIRHLHHNYRPEPTVGCTHPDCDRLFRYSFEMKRHFRLIHTGDGPNSTHNIMTHTGHKPYGCFNWPLRLQSKRSASNHFKRKHNNNGN